ncbi:alpha/beta hydrolase fold domain-containing protein [Embleya scabrispora]|uniref:alpha/beta hydrolase fold domain-containing protein n=1 Tax=Embleya scabrispora TaxID=159449 RepID=UPI000369C020|nr:alpha/beta hydrolase fold domain-containing protein [Embleya scabrispora]MYS79743.1 alpha/beta hydrolase fold domain-containing protein [Streptomyces sp. SID5474]
MTATHATLDPLPPSITIPGADHDVPVRIFAGGPGSVGLLVWAHGGSWRSGGTADWAPALAHLARIGSTTVVGVDYRLAPENPHPAALLDVLTVLDRALDRAGGEPVSVGGDSAGATIAASAALVRRDPDRPLAAQVLAYPPIDPDRRAESYRSRPGAFPSRAALGSAWRAYRGQEPVHPAAVGARALYSTPHEAADLAGVAPAILAVGSLDPVVDDVRGYARRLRAAGVPVELHEPAGTGHGAFLTDPSFRHRLGTAYAAAHRGARPPRRIR